MPEHTTQVQGVPEQPHEHPLLDIDGTLFLQLALFLLMVIVLSKLLFKPFLKVSEERFKATEGAKGEANKMVEKASHDGAVYETKLGEARAKALAERGVLRAEAHKREREILEQGRDLATKHLEATTRVITENTTKARAELAPRVSDLAQEISKKILGRSVGAKS
jgi:F-type H+-transporting ATPase subunit b